MWQMTTTIIGGRCCPRGWMDPFGSKASTTTTTTTMFPQQIARLVGYSVSDAAAVFQFTIIFRCPTRVRGFWWLQSIDFRFCQFDGLMMMRLRLLLEFNGHTTTTTTPKQFINHSSFSSSSSSNVLDIQRVVPVTAKFVVRCLFEHRLEWWLPNFIHQQASFWTENDGKRTKKKEKGLERSEQRSASMMSRNHASNIILRHPLGLLLGLVVVHLHCVHSNGNWTRTDERTNEWMSDSPWFPVAWLCEQWSWCGENN